jgi:hypothetical protein
MTPHTAGVASWNARISRAGVLWSRKPTRRNVRFRMFRLSAFSVSPACKK